MADTISILEKPVASGVSKDAYVLGVQDEAGSAALRRLSLASAVEASGVADDTLNKILDPDTYPLSTTEDTVQSIALELGGYSLSTGAKEERSDSVRSAEYLKVSPGDIVYFTFSIPGGEEDAVRVLQYDAGKSFLGRIFKNIDEEFEVGSGVEYLCFYRSDTTDTTMTANLVIKGTTVKAEHKKVYFKDHGYEVRGDFVGGDETLHKLLFYAHGASGNTYNIVEIKAPIAQPDEATLCLMTDDGGNGLCQFVDFSCMTYGGERSVEIVNQVRGRNPLPEFSIRFNDGKGAGRVKKLTVQPDAIPMELTSTGIKVRRNNSYDNKGAENEFATVDLAELFDTVTTLKSIVVKLMSQVAPETISTENGWEVGSINSTTGEEEAGTDYIRTINNVAVTANTLLVFSAVGGLLASGPLSVYEYESNGSYLGRTYIYEGDTLTTSATTAYIRLTANTGVVEAGSYATATFYPGKMANTTSTEGDWEIGSINSSTGATQEASSQIRTASAVAVPASTEFMFTAFGAILSEGDSLSVFEYATDGSYIQRTYVDPGGTMTTSSTTASLKIRAETNVVEGSYVKLTYYTEYAEE